MSENYLKLIPRDSYFIPDESTHQDAIELLEKLTPDGEEVEAEVYSELTFIDQGQNLEEINCPSCSTSLKQNIYTEDETDCEKIFNQISEQSDDEELDSGIIQMPCCSNEVKTTDLTFKWTAGFAKFELSVLNPQISEQLSEENVAALSKILGCELLQIWAHY